MDLTSDHPFWFIKNGLLNAYPALTHDVNCNIAVIGGGFTGAIIAYTLTKLGQSVVLLDRRDVCLGSTSASTGLLQYELDVPLIELASQIGRPQAERVYQLTYRTIDRLQTLIDEVGSDCGFARKLSIHLATSSDAASRLREEAVARQSIGVACDFHEPAELRNRFRVNGTAGLSTHQAASCDGYRLAHDLLRAAVAGGAQVFDRTEVVRIESPNQVSGRAKVHILTGRSAVVTAQLAVIATGYEAQAMLPERLTRLENTYAIASQPLDSMYPWDPDWMLWEAKNPYLYVRSTDDNRLLVGGEDDPFHDPARRDAAIPHKAMTLYRKAQQMIPGLAWEVEFAWAGTFGATKDGLGYIGPHPAYPNCCFALGFGGNGMVVSTIASEIVSDAIQKKVNPNSGLFTFGR